MNPTRVGLTMKNLYSTRVEIAPKIFLYKISFPGEKAHNKIALKRPQFLGGVFEETA